MTTLAERRTPQSERFVREFLADTTRHARLEVTRTDIEFWNEKPGVVVIELTVRNHGTVRSKPDVAVVKSAPLGAFLPWEPLGEIAVPPISPGGSVTLRMKATDEPPPLDPRLERTTPTTLLTANDMDDDGEPDAPDDLVTRRRRAGFLPLLPRDILWRIGRGGVHWAGNLNVFVGGVATERHMARALRVHAGRVNAAMFCVGSGRDEYVFGLRGEVGPWDARLAWYRPPHGDGSDATVPLDEPVPLHCMMPMMLIVEPPGSASEGEIVVDVAQVSTGRETCVEFSLDPNAAGPGCFVV